MLWLSNEAQASFLLRLLARPVPLRSDRRRDPAGCQRHKKKWRFAFEEKVRDMNAG
jgi:hypothetical protein